jgi:hypothetical protein
VLPEAANDRLDLVFATPALLFSVSGFNPNVATKLDIGHASQHHVNSVAACRKDFAPSSPASLRRLNPLLQPDRGSAPCILVCLA